MNTHHQRPPLGSPRQARQAPELDELAERIRAFHDREDVPSQHAASFLRELLKYRREKLRGAAAPRI